MIWRLRSLLFNFFFYGNTIVLLALCVPFLLFPLRWQRRVPSMWVASTYWIERVILGLDYDVIGKENLPEAPYIVAMKHQSAWETMKLYALFGDPAIVLKKELMDLPLWGRYARAMDMVPIDRSKGRQATGFMIESAKKVLITKRPLVIFPQGTRVRVGDRKPYKSGAIRLYDELKIPLVPVALNAGVFWPRNAFWKRSGRVTVEILPPIMPGKNPDEVQRQLEDVLESVSDDLARKAIAKHGWEKEFPAFPRN